MPDWSRKSVLAVILNVMTEGTPNTQDRVCQIRAVLDWLRTQELQLAAERDEAILLMVAEGLTYQAIARHAGVTRGRVGQIVQQARG
jgi:DNA-directed RNA polymerase specialized sigma24 family protein